MNSNTIASMLNSEGPDEAVARGEGVVEIGLLLPVNRAAALIRLAKDRQESVGQVIRRMIDRELAASA